MQIHPPLLGRLIPICLLVFAPLAAAKSAQTRPLRIKPSITLQGGWVPSEQFPTEESFHEALLGAEPIEAPVVQRDDDEPPTRTDRTKAFEKLAYDRRPSATLAAWAGEAPQPPAELSPPKAEEITREEVDTQGMTEEQATKAIEKAEAKAEKARAAAAKTAKKEADKQAKAKAEADLAYEVALFEHHITLGQWGEVAAYLKSIPRKDAIVIYGHLLESLVEGPERVSGNLKEFAEKNYFDAHDLLGLITASPGPIRTKMVKEIGALTASAVTEGVLIEACLAVIRPALDNPRFPLQREQLAQLLLEGGFYVEAGEFLPSLEEAEKNDDRGVLNLIARHHLAQFKRDANPTELDAAWRATMSALGAGEIKDSAKNEALKRAVELAPKVHEALGQSWLAQSFTERPERGMEILSLIGSEASKGLFENARSLAARKANLEMQTTATEALLKTNPDLAQEWSDALSLMANNWLQEADCTYHNDNSVSRGQSMNVDSFGNVYYFDNSRGGFNSNAPLPIPTNEMLSMRPSPSWMGHVSPGLAPQFEMLTAQLLLKVEAEEEAFPYIERLALSHPDQAQDLVEEFIRVWIKNNNPNANNNRTNEYMFVFGFSQRAAGIPLTRSKQERNLRRLSHWIERIRALPIDGINEDLLATAFSKSHSSAEVYQLETIESVFGDLGQLEARTVAALVQQMRKNLVGVWRKPSTQENKKTKRRQKDIEAEILKGYATAREFAERSLAAHPNDWSLSMAIASVAHDENNFRQETSKSSEFAPKRLEALAGFAAAAEFYAQALPGLKERDESSALYETWFYASLGACDLQAIDSYKQPVASQLALIREAILDLPGEAATRHMDRFANALFTRISSVNPAVKYSYLESGLSIAGETERTREAHEILAYYRDLITEIQLHVQVDGSDHVGTTDSFGLFVNLRHTGAIERESGGFGKYLVNQNTQTYGFNYGRPTEDYRDKFEEFTRDVLDEHFDVQSITFNHPDTHSRATAEYGWRLTPYAYVLLKARGPQVDRIPALRLDLDFMDSVGYALLPIESAPVPIDCASGRVDARPFGQLKLTQTLDEREAAEGKLLLEIQASARGLLPSMVDLIDLAPEGFHVVQTEDMGNSVSKFDAESMDPLILCDRTWTVEFAANGDLNELPTAFTFGTPRLDAAEVELVHQRYVDADLASVGATIELLSSYGEVDGPGIGTWILGLAGAAGLVLAARKFKQGRGGEHQQARFRVPEPLSPFTVIGLLREIHAHNGLAPDSNRELLKHIEEIESHYFGREDAPSPDLRHIAHIWVQRAT